MTDWAEELDADYDFEFIEEGCPNIIDLLSASIAVAAAPDKHFFHTLSNVRDQTEGRLR